MNAYQTGVWYEWRAALYVLRRGYRLLSRRYRAGKGEIDLIARDGNVLVFIEVKARTKAGQGAGFEAVTADKRRRLRSAASAYQKSRGLLDAPCRFDILEFTKDGAHYMENAF